MTTAIELPPETPPEPPLLSSSVNNDTDPSYNYLEVNQFEVKYANGTQKKYKPLTIPPSKQFISRFALPKGIVPTVSVISEMFLPDTFINSVVKCTNQYSRMKGKNYIRPVTADKILVFVSILFYMGLV